MPDDQPQPQTPLTPAEERTQKLLGLAANLRIAKRNEESTRANRIALEGMIAELIPGKEIGQVTERFPDGSGIVVKRGFNYKADLAGIEGVFVECNGLPAPIKTKTSSSLDVDGYEWYRQNHPELFALLANHVIVTPKKVAVELKPAKGE